MAYDSNMSGTTELDARLVQVYNKAFIISGNLDKGLKETATFKDSVDGKAEEFVIYTKLTNQTSALTEDNEVTSESMADTKKTITPGEYGNAVVLTNLAKLQSGGMAYDGSIATVGVNARESMDAKMIAIGEAGSNELIVTQAAEGSLTSSDTLTAAYVSYAYNRLRRAGIPGPYFAVSHSDVIYDLKIQTGDGSWLGTNQYTREGEIELLMGEIGMFGGFRWIESGLVSVNADAGNSTTDTYHTQFYGMNAFGYVESQAPGLVIRNARDKLGRFYDIGWYGVYEFGLVDTNAHWLVTSASSIGSN